MPVLGATLVLEVKDKALLLAQAWKHTPRCRSVVMTRASLMCPTGATQMLSTPRSGASHESQRPPGEMRPSARVGLPKSCARAMKDDLIDFAWRRCSRGPLTPLVLVERQQLGRRTPLLTWVRLHAHRRCSRAMFTGHVHWPCSRAVFTGHVHWPCSLAMFTGHVYWPEVGSLVFLPGGSACRRTAPSTRPDSPG